MEANVPPHRPRHRNLICQLTGCDETNSTKKLPVKTWFTKEAMHALDRTNGLTLPNSSLNQTRSIKPRVKFDRIPIQYLTNSKIISKIYLQLRKIKQNSDQNIKLTSKDSSRLVE